MAGKSQAQRAADHETRADAHIQKAHALKRSVQAKNRKLTEQRHTFIALTLIARAAVNHEASAVLAAICQIGIEAGRPFLKGWTCPSPAPVTAGDAASQANTSAMDEAVPINVGQPEADSPVSADPTSLNVTAPHQIAAKFWNARFESSPASAVREKLKDAGGRFNGVEACWWGVIGPDVADVERVVSDNGGVFAYSDTHP